MVTEHVHMPNIYWGNKKIGKNQKLQLEKVKTKDFKYTRNRSTTKGYCYQMIQNNDSSNILVEIQYVITEIRIRAYFSILQETFP